MDLRFPSGPTVEDLIADLSARVAVLEKKLAKK